MRRGVVSQKLADTSILVNTGNGHGSTNTKIRRFTTTVYRRSSSISFVDTSADGSSFVVNDPGVYVIDYADQSSTEGEMGLSLNSTEFTTNVDAIAAADRIGIDFINAANQTGDCNATLFCKRGDIIRAHSSGTLSGTGATVSIKITKISDQ